MNFYLEGVPGLYNSLSGCILPAMLLMPLYGLKMIGAGDIKLFCAVGSVAGISLVVYIMILSFLSGGIIAVIIMIARKNLKKRFIYLFNFLKSCILSHCIQSYPDFSEGHHDFRFRFSYAVASGAILCFIFINGI